MFQECAGSLALAWTIHIYHLQKIHLVVQVAVIQTCRYSTVIAKWDSQEIMKLESLWMRAFKKTWRVNASVSNVIFCVGPEQAW